jgi:DNA-directed RNA polymerase subunit omega
LLFAGNYQNVTLFQSTQSEANLRDEYIRDAQKVISDPNILINVVSRRVKQLKFGHKPLVESLERLSPEDIALREIIEGKITYELYEPESV